MASITASMRSQIVWSKSRSSKTGRKRATSRMNGDKSITAPKNLALSDLPHANASNGSGRLHLQLWQGLTDSGGALSLLRGKTAFGTNPASSSPGVSLANLMLAIQNSENKINDKPMSSTCQPQFAFVQFHNALARERPSPEPGSFRLFSRRTKRSVTRSKSSSGIPGPLSAMRM